MNSTQYIFKSQNIIKGQRNLYPTNTIPTETRQTDQEKPQQPNQEISNHKGRKDEKQWSYPSVLL